MKFDFSDDSDIAKAYTEIREILDKYKVEFAADVEGEAWLEYIGDKTEKPILKIV